MRGMMTKAGVYHCAVKSVGRSTGRSAVAAAAYRSGQRLEDDRTGLTHDYRAKGGVIESFIVAPADAPSWANDRQALWNEVEAASTAKNARLATELELALPHELTADQRRELVEKFARAIMEQHRVAVDVSIHAPGKEGDHRNFHAHVMITHRDLGPEGFGEIANTRTIDRKVKGRVKPVIKRGAFNEEDMIPTREAWAVVVNDAYQAAGLNVRVDHRSHQDRGLAAEPTTHLGYAASGLERRGEASDRGDLNRGITARNAERAKIEDERMTLSAAIAELVAERERRADGREMRAAIRTASANRILEAMTEKRATFSRAELVATLRRGVDTRAEAANMATELLAHPDVIGLREKADAAVTRYTTRAVLADERQVLKDARSLAGRPGSALTERQRNAALRTHRQLDEEQRAAFAHATGGRGLALVAGEAGTGKSTTLAAIRDAYEGGGYRVIGMAWTNAVVQDMAADGFRETSTIAAALARVEKGKDAWGRKTVLVVDEAAMLSSRHLGRVLKEAERAGAKVILAGDDQQLASIERGGMFSALQAEHGAAELHTVRRVQDQAQRQAFNHMHAGEFGAALDIFDRAGAITWTDKQDDARAALVAQWAADTKAEPGKSRFVFAYSNADVAELNADLRAIRKERGELGADQLLQTKDGATAFAKGDRVQFAGSAYGREGKALGLVNGGMATVREIDGSRMTVELDGRGKQAGRVVSFTVGDNDQAGQFNAIRHGYAGTIYKGQGRTLDQSYLYHSENWRASAAYVALSRHRESTSLFVAREVTRGRDPWMMATGGLEGLDERQKKAAERSYQDWAEEMPKAAERYGLADYVSYVQGKQGERGRSAYDLEQLTRQISRADETRAASQFVADEGQQKAAQGGGRPIPTLSGARRYDALREAAKAAVRPVMDPIAALLSGKGATGRRKAPAGLYDPLKAPAKTAEATTQAAPVTPAMPTPTPTPAAPAPQPAQTAEKPADQTPQQASSRPGVRRLAATYATEAAKAAAKEAAEREKNKGKSLGNGLEL
jgi:Ti-type conjugative transfer relaxase TraA